MMTTDALTKSGVGDHAVVLGASMAGLLAARVLANHFERVTVIDRDALVDDGQPRKGVPQGYHLHVLLDQGRHILEQLLPGLIDDIANAGGIVIDPGQDLIWYQSGDYTPHQDTDLQFLCVSRPFLEQHVRARVAALGNVVLRTGLRFKGFGTTERRTRVTGAQLTRGGGGSESVEADLIVDAMGRNSPIPKWLEESGFGAPQEEVVKVWMGYSTRLWRRDPADTPIHAYMIQPTPPHEVRIGIMFPIEDDRWISSIGGWGTDQHAPTDDTGYLDYAKTLPTPDIYEVMNRSEPLTPIRPFKFPSSIRRHFEKMNRFPDGFISIGDAISSFNPIYGQGMSSAAMQAESLDLALQAGGLDGLGRRFFKQAAKAVDIPWTFAVGADFRFDTTEGRKPPGTDLINRYVYRFNRAMNRNPNMTLAFGEVLNLSKPASSLFHPRWLWQVLRVSG